MGLIGIVQNDIKRVVAYSTLSQLGYMTVALGASAYAAGIFHLMTHAFFKALLFLAAGSVIIAMHHEQDIRRMGGLRRYMPITYSTALVGSLALIGFPFFSGFFSKDGIIEAVAHSTTPGAGFAYVLVLLGVFVTALYTFRMFFLVFHGEERFRNVEHHGHDEGHGHGHVHEPKESPWVVTVPLILLAIPSVVAGYVVGPMLFGDFFADSIFVLEANDVLARLGEGYTGVMDYVVHGIMMPPFWLAMAGLATAWYVYLVRPQIADAIKSRFGWLYRVLDRKYGFDELNAYVFAGGSVGLGRLLWRFGDMLFIDGLLVDGSAKTVGFISRYARFSQTGYLYHYAFAMIIGLLVLLTAFVL
jgi:NADH-quinone oxidoreductase subunit L